MKENHVIFHDGKHLLESCISRLNENQCGETGGNVALHPTVLVLLGNKSRCNTKYVKSTLDDNWNNARFLQYLNVVKTDSGWQCFRLAGTRDDNLPDAGAENFNAQDTDGYDRDSSAWEDYVWEAEHIGWTETLNHAIVAMLETEEKIFSERTIIRMEYILDASEKDGTQYADLFLQTSNAMQSDEQKTLYLMLDQRPGADHVETSDALLQYLADKNETSKLSGTVCLLSNYLQSGQMLGDGRIWQNYRLAADMILLSGSKMAAQSAVHQLSGGFKTVSYALVTKPTEEIAAVTLRTLMHEIYDSSQKNLFRELSASELAAKLQMDRYHGFLFLEELFQKKIRARFPKEADWRYLPFTDIQAYRTFLKSPNLTIEAADALSSGAASEFLNRYYIEPVRDFLSNEKEMQQCTDRVSGLLFQQFAYFELLYLNEHQEELDHLIMSEYQSAGFRSRSGVCAGLHEQGIYESRRIYYHTMKQVIAAQMHHLIQQAISFRDMYEACEKEVRRECIVTGDESESIEKFYSGIAAEYAGCHTFSEIFLVSNKKEDLLRNFWNIYLELMRENVYNCDFEQEVDYRMEGMDEKQRHTFVEKELRKKLDGSRRLKNSIEMPMTRAGCYYMVNAGADYAKTLEQAENGEYVLFHLNRTDCIEQLEIYDILKPKQLHLGNVRNGNDNQTKAPGLPDSGTDIQERSG